MSESVSFGTLNYSILFIYLACMVGMGVYLSRKQQTTEDFFLAGRNMPWIVVAMSIFASLTSAISYMSMPARAYEENISMIAGFLVGPFAAMFMIKVFCPFYQRLRVTTSYEYIAMRFGNSARYVVSTLFILARVGWLGVVIYAPSLALNIATGINLYLAITLMGILATFYTMLGGLSAVLWTDVVQFLILVGGGIWVAVSLICTVPDGLGGIMQIASDSGRLGGFDWSFSFFKMTAVGSMFAYFIVLVHDYGVDQVAVQRLLAVKDSRGMAKALLTNSIFDVFIVALLLFMGLGMFAYYQSFPNPEVAALAADRVLAYYIVHALPPGVSGLVISAIFAAAMSSMDSGIHSLSTVITNDFVRPLRRKAATDKHDLKLARMLVLVIGLGATIVAFWAGSFKHIQEAAAIFLGTFTGPILALFLLGVFTRRAHFWAWLPGMILGVIASFYAQRFTNLHWLYYFPTACGITLIVGYLLSLIIRRPLADIELTLWRKAKAD